MEAGRRIVVQRESMTGIRLKVNGRIHRARKERLDELWGPDAIAVAAAGRVVVLAGDELSRGVDCQRFVGDLPKRSMGKQGREVTNHTRSGPLKSVVGPKTTLSEAYVPTASGCLTSST